MLKRENRLKKRYQFDYVYKHGTRFSSKFVTIYVTPSKTNHIKVGFAVSKKIGHAVVRNKVRRRLREVVYPLVPKIKQANNLIVLAKEGITEASFENLKKQLNELITKAGLFLWKNFLNLS